MRYREIKLVESKIQLNEAEARIQHAEDIVFWEGSKGAVRALDSLLNLEKGQHTNVTIKWDGSPAIIFGRDENGEFILTDKSGFGAKGYDGKAKSAKDVAAMFMSRPGAQNDPEGYRQLAGNMADIFDEYEKAVPSDLIGFFKGDLLYFNTPEKQNGNYIFTPNIVTYTVAENSDLGQRIARSKTGIVIHRYIDPTTGQETEIAPAIRDKFQGEEVLIFPSVTVQQPAEIDDENINNLKALVAQNAQAIDALLNVARLTELKIKDFSQVLYTYTNHKVDGDLSTLGDDFENWLSTSKLSDPKKKRIFEWIRENNQGFIALWTIVKGIQQIKDDVINQFDSHNTDVKASIGPHGPVTSDAHGEGGEGYVMAHPQGDIKLVPRKYFTRANRSVQR